MTKISIHALRVEGDIRLTDEAIEIIEFLSTPSGWRATESLHDDAQSLYISIHALRVEGDGITVYPTISWSDISIHALRVEGDVFRLNRAVGV